MTDRFIRAYDSAKRDGSLSAICMRAGCGQQVLTQYRSARHKCGNARAVKIYSAFVSMGYISREVPIGELFPGRTERPKRKLDQMRVRKPKAKKPAQFEAGSLADLWLEWICDGLLTVETLKTSILKQNGRPTMASEHMREQCGLAIERASNPDTMRRIDQRRELQRITNEWLCQ